MDARERTRCFFVSNVASRVCSRQQLLCVTLCQRLQPIIRCSTAHSGVIIG